MRLFPGNPMGRVLQAILVFEVIVFGLALPVMIMVSDTSPVVAALACAGAMVLGVAAAATLRSSTGYLLGWLTQAAGLAMGLLTYGMLVMGVTFASLWVVTFVLGRRLDNQRGGASPA